MKMVKSLLLGTAAGFVAMAGAQAADLPVKAKPVQYVKICSLYGVGFYYIPGTDMCIKVGGWARFEIGEGYNGSLTNEWFAVNLQNRSTSDHTWRVKGTVTFDARSPTEYGTVRSYVAIGLSTSDNGNGSAGLAATGNGSGTDDVANYLNRWFIQWAGFTVGRSVSFYDFYSVGANQYGYVTASSDSGDGGWPVFGYTAQFGNGLSGTISAEVQRRAGIFNAGAATGVLLAAGGLIPVGAAGVIGMGGVRQGLNYEGQDYPDLVANLRADQAWGSAQVMGALHEVNATYYGVTEGTGHPGGAMGFALGAGITLKADMITRGDYFTAEVDYTQGASRYSNMRAGAFDYSMYNGNSYGFGLDTDATYGGVNGVNASGLELTTTWAVNAAYTHNWNTAWKSTLWGSYMADSYDGLANAMICSGAGAGVGAGTAAVATAGCDMDWSVWGLGLRTQWAVSSTFYMGLEVVYSKLNSASTPFGLINLAANVTKPAGTYTVSDQDAWAMRFRVHRDFYP